MSIEVERKYDVPAGEHLLPDLSAVDGVAAVERLDDEHLDATYHDTKDLRLARAGATLRRRTGGRDAGWHLKLPAAGSGRHEITAPARARTAPKALRALVRSRTRGAPLSPVVRLRTTRSVLRLLDGDGRALAEVADDQVTAEQPDGPTAVSSQWREVEVELLQGDVALLDAVEEHLRAWGAVPSPWASKLRRALGGRLSDDGSEAGRGTAADAVLAHLREHVSELVARDPLVRRDEHDAVHKMRVATRRLRSALKTFRPLLDRSVTDPVRTELTHLAGVLGAARDAEVLRDRLSAQLADEPAELVLGSVRQRAADTMTARYRDAHAAVVAELDGARYLALLEALDGLLVDPPWTGAAPRRARTSLPPLVAQSWKQLRHARAAVDAAGTEQERLDLLHEVRKAAKQARYAGEAVAPELGQKAVRFAARAEAVQEALGEHQDSVVSRELLHELAVAAHRDGEDGFTLGRLHGLEELRAERAERQFEQAWARLDRRKVLAWLG